MRKLPAIIISIAITLTLVTTEILIAYLFPRYDIGGFFLVLFLLVWIPVGVGIAGFFLLKAIKGKVRIILTIAGLVIATFLLQVSLHPSHTNPWIEIYSYSEVFGEYPDRITYENLAFGNEQARVAASLKFRDSLPDRIATIEIRNEGSDMIKEQYFIELKNNLISYDKSKISLTENSGSLLLVTNPDDSAQKEYLLKGWNSEMLFHLYQGASISFGDERLYQSAHDFRLSTGAEKLFYWILSIR